MTRSNITDRQARPAEIFRRCRESVSAEDAARQYGVRIDRSGKALCPFHNDHKPSLSFRYGRFRCWSCGAGGDSIDFTARLLGLNPLQAVRKLNEDFHLGLPIDRPQTVVEGAQAARREQLTETQQCFEEWRQAILRDLCEAFRVGHAALLSGRDLSDTEALAVRYMAALEYWADILEGEEMKDIITVFQDRKAVKRICDQILNRTPTRFGAA